MAQHHDSHDETLADEDRCIDTKAAAKMLGLSPITLHQWRLHGKGPAFLRFSRQIRYQVSAIRRYMAANTIGGAR